MEPTIDCLTAAASDKLLNFFIKDGRLWTYFLEFFKMADLIITEDFSRSGARAVHEEESRRDDNDSWLGLD